jgi:hypothetical protein
MFLLRGPDRQAGAEAGARVKKRPSGALVTPESFIASASRGLLANFCAFSGSSHSSTTVMSLGFVRSR